MSTIIIAVSTTGTSLQSAWNSLPATVDAADTYVLEMQAGAYTAGLDCLASAKTINGRVIVRPAAGAAWYEDASPSARFDSTKGVSIAAVPGFVPLINLAQNVTLDGLQIKGGGSSGVVGAASNRTGCQITRCIIYAASTDFRCLFALGTFPALIANNIFIQDASNAAQPAISIADTSSAPDIVNNTVIRPNGGGGAWFLISVGSLSRIVNNAIFGMSPTVASVGASSNNATNNSTVCGTSGVVNLTTANQFNNVTLATLDVRPKAGNGLVAGVTTGLVTTDVFGTARASTPTIGAIEYVIAAAPFASDGTSSATATAALTTQIRLAAISSAIASATANLTNNGFSAAAVSVSSSTSSMSTGILLAAAASAVVTTTSALTTSALVGFTSPQLKNNSGTILANETGIAVNVYNVSTGALVVRKTGLTSDASGYVIIKDVSLVAATTYAYEVVLASNGRRLPTATAS